MGDKVIFEARLEESEDGRRRWRVRQGGRSYTLRRGRRRRRRKGSNPRALGFFEDLYRELYGDDAPGDTEFV